MSPPALAAIHYSDTHKGMLLQTSGTLPYGRYEQCLEIIPGSGAEAGGQLCSSLISDEVDQFDLFYPYDGDSIPETRPVLNWTHTAPDQLATNVDAYELVLVHCEAPCNDPKAAVALENPVVLVHGLRTTTVPFPADAGDLRRGHEYAWQVQRWDAEQGFMIAATDVWKFKVMDRQPPREQRYAVLRHDMNGERYEANDRRVYFRFDEPYASSGLACTLYDNELRPLVPAVSTDGPTAERGKAGFAPKSNGPNLYEVDLQQFGSGTGYFILEVKDEKKRTYYLRIHAPR